MTQTFFIVYLVSFFYILVSSLFLFCSFLGDDLDRMFQGVPSISLSKEEVASSTAKLVDIVSHLPAIDSKSLSAAL